MRIGGRRMHLRRAVDDEGKVLDMLVHKRRNKQAALRLLRKLLKHQDIHPQTIVTDGLLSYGAAVGELGCSDRHRPRAAARQQSRREFASTDPAPCKKAVTVHIAGFYPEISRDLRCRLQHLQCPTSFDPPFYSRLSQGRSRGDVEQGDCGSMSIENRVGL